MDYAAFIDRYDRPTTLFYLDPPYWGNENDYWKGMFARDDFAQMAEQLGKLKGHFVLSINDVPQVRELFQAFHITPVTTTYFINKDSQSATNRAELLISNVEQTV